MEEGVALGLSCGLSVVLFYMMAVVSEDVLVPALQVLCQRYEVPRDVAGATFLAAGASLPELVSTVVSMYVTKTDVGVGTVVGSEIFNHCAICGAVCANAASRVELDPIDCARDVVGYAGALLFLLLAVSSVERRGSDDDDEVRAVVAVRPLTTLPLVLWYGAYAYLCTSDGRFALGRVFAARRRPEVVQVLIKPRAGVTKKKEDETTPLRLAERAVPVDDASPSASASASGDSCSASAASEVDDGAWGCFPPPRRHDEKRRHAPEAWLASLAKGAASSAAASSAAASSADLTSADVTSADVRSFVVTVLTLPATIPLWATLPREPAARPHVAVAASLAWLCLLSFGMVVVLETAAAILGVAPSVVGLTAGAIGTSFPNLVSASAAARRGSADMAVSSSLGANVFNLSIALGVPWLLWPLVHPREPIFTGLHDTSLTLLTLGLLVTALAYALLLYVTDCTLSPSMAFLFLLAYLGFVFAAVFAQPSFEALENRTQGGH